MREDNVDYSATVDSPAYASLVKILRYEFRLAGLMVRRSFPVHFSTWEKLWVRVPRQPLINPFFFFFFHSFYCKYLNHHIVEMQLLFLNFSLK